MLALVAAASAARSAPERSGGAALRFVDRTAESGLVFRHRSGAAGRRRLPEIMGAGGCVLDADGDGRFDLLLVQSGALERDLSQRSVAPQLFRNVGGGRLARFADGSGLAARGYGQGAVCADYDGDGDTDIFLASFGPDSLFANDGHGRFRDVTIEAGLGTDDAWGSSAVFFDADRDGDLDLYVVNYLAVDLARYRPCADQVARVEVYCHPDAFAASPDRYFRNVGGGRFVDATREAGLSETTGKGMAALALDFDDDADPDLYVTNDSTPNFLLRNRGDGTFEEVGLPLGVAVNDLGRTEAGMGVDAGDVDGDGTLDLFVTNLALEANALYLGTGAGGPFRYGSKRAGLAAPSLPYTGFGTHLVDLDLDGDLDLVVVNGDVVDNVELLREGATFRQPALVFANDGLGRFARLADAVLGELAGGAVRRGTMLIDLDDDGRTELVVANNDAEAELHFVVGARGHWLGVELSSPGANRAAIGARVIVEAGGRRRLAEVRAGSSYQSSSDPRLVFGLGAADRIDALTVRWPDGARERFEGLAVDRYHRLRQGSGRTAGAAVR